MAASNPLLEVFISGLRNIRAIEVESLVILRTQVRRSAGFPILESRLRQHLEETHIQKARLDTILDGLSEASSLLKDIAGSVMGRLDALNQAAESDEVLRNIVASAALENLEIASYRSLIIVAHECGNADAAILLQQSLSEELDMARWLQDNLHDITASYLARVKASGS